MGNSKHCNIFQKACLRVSYGTCSRSWRLSAVGGVAIGKVIFFLNLNCFGNFVISCTGKHINGNCHRYIVSFEVDGENLLMEILS